MDGRSTRGRGRGGGISTQRANNSTGDGRDKYGERANQRTTCAQGPRDLGTEVRRREEDEEDGEDGEDEEDEEEVVDGKTRQMRVQRRRWS